MQSGLSPEPLILSSSRPYQCCLAASADVYMYKMKFFLYTLSLQADIASGQTDDLNSDTTISD